MTGSSLFFAEKNGCTIVREGSNLDLDSYFLSHSVQNGHEPIEQQYLFSLKEPHHIERQIENCLKDRVHVQVCVRYGKNNMSKYFVFSMKFLNPPVLTSCINVMAANASFNATPTGVFL